MQQEDAKPDPYAVLAELGVRLAQVRADITKFKALEDRIRLQIAEVATVIAGGAREIIDTDSDSEELPAKRLELLRLVAKRPDGDYAYFAEQMYGDDTRSNRINIAGLFGHLKAGGYAEATGRGQHQITAKGKEALSRAA